MATTLTEINSLGDNNTLVGANHTQATGGFQIPWHPEVLLSALGLNPLPQSSAASEEAGFLA